MLRHHQGKTLWVLHSLSNVPGDGDGRAIKYSRNNSNNQWHKQHTSLRTAVNKNECQ